MHPANYVGKQGGGATRMTSEQNERDTTSDWLLSLVKTMRADMDNDKLYPPGDVYIMASRRVESEVERDPDGLKLNSPADGKEYHDVFVTLDGHGEAKFDGERTICHKQAQRVVSRGGLSVTSSKQLTWQTLQKCESVIERFSERECGADSDLPAPVLMSQRSSAGPC